MKKKIINWLEAVGVRIIKTMAETAIAVIGTNAMGITDVDWLGVLSAVALSGVVTALINIKNIPDVKTEAEKNEDDDESKGEGE